MAFAFNFILEAIGWRWTFRVAALPGFLMALVMVVTVKEPRRAVVRLGRGLGVEGCGGGHGL